MGQDPGFSSRNMFNDIFEFFCRTKALIQEDNFRQRTRFPKHRPSSSSTTNQKKATYPSALTPNSAIKTAPWKPWENVRVPSTSHPISARGPFAAPDPQVWVCLASRCVFLCAWTCIPRRCRLHGFNSKSYETGVCSQVSAHLPADAAHSMEVLTGFKISIWGTLICPFTLNKGCGHWWRKYSTVL